MTLRTMTNGINRGSVNRPMYMDNYQAFLPGGCQFYAPLFDSDAKGYGILANGTGIATPLFLVAGDNTITNTQAGTIIVTLPLGRTGTATSGTATVTGSPQSLVAGDNTVTITGTGTITVNVADKFVERSPNAIVCTNSGALWLPQGRSLDGVDDKIVAAWQGFPTTAVTVSCWVYIDPLAANMDGVAKGIWESLNSALDGCFLLWNDNVGQGRTNALAFRFYGQTGYSPATCFLDNIITVAGFYYITCRYDKDEAGAEQLDLRLNGVQKATSNFTEAITTPDTNFTIGARASGATNMQGTIGELAIWNRKISVATDMSNYLATKWRYQ